MPHTQTNGIATFYEDTSPEGASSPEPVVLIHGHSVDLRMWRYQVPALLQAGYRVVRYDVRGHGRSTAPPEGYTWDHYAADLAGLLDRLNPGGPVSRGRGLESAHLVALSMGGGIALQFALDFPHRVRSITLVDSALPGFTYSDEFTSQIEALVGAVRSEGPQAAFERLWLPHPFFDGVRRYPDRFEQLREMVLSYPAADYREGATPKGYTPTVSDHLHEIAAPTLVIVGELDIPDFRLIAELLAANLTSARLLSFPECGHLPPLEDPDAFNTALVAFLGDRSSSGAAAL
jgi:pimeloyl-ACP methyl ester carboxylesterase